MMAKLNKQEKGFIDNLSGRKKIAAFNYLARYILDDASGSEPENDDIENLLEDIANVVNDIDNL